MTSKKGNQMTDIQKQLDAKDVQIAELEKRLKDAEGLVEYATHTSMCRYHMNASCDCGYIQSKAQWEKRRVE